MGRQSTGWRRSATNSMETGSETCSRALICWLAVCLMAGPSCRSAARSPTVESLYERASPWPPFLSAVTANRDLWQRVGEHAAIPAALIDRFAHAGHDLRLLIVAEDWCTDSANTIPYVVRLASLADVDVRILDRTLGASLMSRHPSADGRGVTPLVVFIRGHEDAGAWVERPRALQAAFKNMVDDSESRHTVQARQAWYDADRGRSALEEIVQIAERTAVSR